VKMWGKPEKEEGWQTYNLPFGKNNLSLYFGYYIEGDTLEEDGIEFGISSEDDSGSKIIENIKISKELENKYMLDKENKEVSIYTNFTLISYSKNSRIDLFRNFNSWLENFPDNKIKKTATGKFHNSLKVGYKKEILNKR